MAEAQTIAAYTERHTPAPGAVVAYVSIDPAPELGAGGVELTVRDRAGHTSSIKLPAPVWRTMLGQAAGRAARAARAG